MQCKALELTSSHFADLFKLSAHRTNQGFTYQQFPTAKVKWLISLMHLVLPSL